MSKKILYKLEKGLLKLAEIICAPSKTYWILLDKDNFILDLTPRNSDGSYMKLN